MKKTTTLLLLFLTIASSSLKAQNFTVPDLPKTKEEFVQSEADFIAAAKWLEVTKIDLKATNRTVVNAWVYAWVINSPTVTVVVRASLLKAYDKNAQLNAVFMAAYSRYALENSYSTDELKCNLAAMKAVINCYKLGGDLKKDKTLEKIIELDNQGKLEDWVKEAMAKK